MLTDQLANVATMKLADAAHALGVSPRTLPDFLARNGIDVIVLSPRRKRVKVADLQRLIGQKSFPTAGCP